MENNIVVLDGHTLNPGDLSWEGLESLGNCTVYDRSRPEEVVARARGAQIVFTNKTPLDRATLQALPQLRYIGVLATGYNVVDLAAARAAGITVTNIPTYGTRSVAQHVFALLLELTQRVGHHAATVQAGRWSAGPDFCYWDYPLVELAGRTMGIVGYGRIGQATAQVARGFGMEILAHDNNPAHPDAPPARMAGLDTLLAESDVVSLHCPLTPETTGMIDARRLALMKPTAFLINTSRGPLINEADLAAALDAGGIAGAGLDVLPVEPPPADCRLFKARNCIITPHIAWATHSARARLMGIAVANLRAFLDGKPVNVVNPG